MLSALLLILLGTSSLAKDKWIRLRSPHFEAFSNAGGKKSKKLLGELEQFRFVFFRLFGLDGTRQLPVRVMIFKNSRSFDPFKPVYEGKPTAVSGYFQAGNDYNLIAMEQASGGDSPLSGLGSSGSLSARELTDARLKYLDYLEKAERQAEKGEAPPVPAPAESAGATGKVEILAPPQANCHPDFTSLQGAVPRPGRLLRVECETGIIYVVQIDGRETRLVGENPNQPVVFSCEVRLETFECGPLPYPVTVFLPGNLPRDEATGADVVRAIELKSPE